MKNRINVAELLKDCPKGMELDCTMYNSVTLINVDNSGNTIFPIKVKLKNGDIVNLTKYGQYTTADFAKCVIFPKGKTTWEGFVPPCKFKDGDIVAFDTEKGAQLFIFKENIYNYDCVQCYMMLDCGGEIDFEIGDYYVERFATEEEKEKLFQAIKDNGYKWNPETKTLEKLVKLEFEIDDWVVFNNHPEKGSIYQVKDTHNYEYTLQHILGGSMPIPFSKVDMLKLWTIDDAKNCDVLVDKDNNIGIFQKFEGIYWYSYIYLGCDGKLRGFSIGGSHEQTDVHPATKEQRDLLFQKIKEAGYKWNSETKTLEKLIQSKFKVGDKVRHKNNHNVVVTITNIQEDYYACGTNKAFWFTEQDDYELVSNKFDITTLKPFDKVLVRLTKDSIWHATFFSHYDKEIKWGCYPFVTTSSKSYPMCIPYKGNEHLTGKKDNCDEYYRIW